MGLPWVRLDTAFASNPKVLALISSREGYRAAFVYVCALAYSGAHETDGFIPREALPFLHARESDADRLAAQRLWIEQPGGWIVNGWDEKQQSTTESQERRKRAQSAAQVRWEGHESMTDAERAKAYRRRKKARE